VSPQPIRRTYAVARAYCEQLRALMDQLRADPLDESKSAALIDYIVNNRSTAADLFDIIDSPRMEAAC
jgi:hypothetical protein